MFQRCRFGNCRDDRKPVFGFMFMIEGVPVFCKSRKQTITALSTLEAEYYALAESMKNALWLKYVLLDLKLWSRTGGSLFIMIIKDVLKFSISLVFYMITMCCSGQPTLGHYGLRIVSDMTRYKMVMNDSRNIVEVAS